jgi:ATP-dependent RNA helicase MSS116
LRIEFTTKRSASAVSFEERKEIETTMETTSQNQDHGPNSRGAGGNNGRNSNRRRGGRKNQNPSANNEKGPKTQNRNNPRKHKGDSARLSEKNKRPKQINIPKKLAHITEKRFADLQISAESRRAMAEVFGYEFMTAVQAETLPLILQENKDCLAKAKTGTGKTLAFMIPTIEKIIASMSQKGKPRSDICCLVISPTRELAQQIGTESEKLLSFHKSHLRKVVVCVGGTNKNKDMKALSGTTPIVVATPGRLLDHLQTSDLAQRMARLDTLIFDEADQLLDMGFRPDIERILRLLQPSRQTRQTLLFSATIPSSVSEIAGIAMRPDYNFVDTVGEESEQTHLHVQQQLMVAPQAMQIDALANILNRETSTGKNYKIIVFFTTARLTGFMAEIFNSVKNQTGYDVLEIHSRKSQKQRERASEEFRKRKNAVMFSSDVTARGMDYPDVSFVLQVGLTDRSQYIHRLGRTARAGKDGKGGLLLADYERDYMVKKELSDMPLELIPVPSTDKAVSAAVQAIRNVSSKRDLTVSAEQAYRAWLGYYNGQLKKVKWDKKTLVQQANMWGKEIGLSRQPSLQKKTIGKMGLRGTPGLIIEN